MSQVTLKDIARSCGLSVQAVSAALKRDSGHGTTKISEKTRERVRQVAESMGYESDLLAASLRGGMSMSVGIIQSYFRMPFGIELVNSLIRTLHERGFDAYIGNVSGHNSGESIDQLISGFRRRKVDGIISLFTKPSELSGVDFSPLLQVGDFGHVGIDLSAGAYDLTKHLLECHGHRRIGILCSVFGGIKQSGYRRAMEEHGIDPLPEWSVSFQKNPDGMVQFRDAIRRHGVTAFLASNDYVAGKVIHFLQRHGIRVPEDIAVVGFDGMSFGKFLSPSLTTMIQPMETLGREAGEMMSRCLLENGELPPEPLLLKPSLRLGGSCGCAEHFDNHILWINTFATIEEEEQSVSNYDASPLSDVFAVDVFE